MHAAHICLHATRKPGLGDRALPWHRQCKCTSTNNSNFIYSLSAEYTLAVPEPMLHPSVYIRNYLSIYPSVHISIDLSIDLVIYVFLPLNLPTYLPACLPAYLAV